jgi:ATP-dependent Clp protease ATP-binding subunit ClpA
LLPLQDQYVSVEELLQAMADDPRFGAELFQQQGLGRDKLEEVIQEIRGGKT